MPGLIAIALALAGALGLAGPASALEQLAYSVVLADGSFEVRDYPPAVAAEVVRGGDRGASVDAAFRELAAFIFATDRDGPKIAMTAPVTQTAVTQAPAGDGGWTVRFMMPRGSTIASLPKPGGDVLLVDLPATRVAAVRFSGRWTDENFASAQAALRGWIAAHDLHATGPATYAYYDPPFKPWFMRRNEVLIPVAADGPGSRGSKAPGPGRE